MAVISRAAEEAVGLNFDLAKMLEARARAFVALDEIGRRITPGMSEGEAVALATQVLEDAKIERCWHATKVRFGANTLLGFPDPSDPATALQADDIFFVDLGPVWFGCEADIGDTFVVGEDQTMHAAARDVKVLFDRVRKVWLEERASGVALYDFAAREAARMGWVLNPRTAGHRLSDFPHRIHHTGKLAAAPYEPSPALWVLEIQIAHPERPIGAFFEDLLLAEA